MQPARLSGPTGLETKAAPVLAAQHRACHLRAAIFLSPHLLRDVLIPARGCPQGILVALGGLAAVIHEFTHSRHPFRCPHGRNEAAGAQWSSLPQEHFSLGTSTVFSEIWFLQIQLINFYGINSKGAETTAFLSVLLTCLLV